MAAQRDGPLLERERELEALDGLLAGLAGGGRVVVVEGPAGIGKSRLLRELRRRAGARGVRALAARGGELERDFPFGVVRQLLEPALAAPEERARLLQGAAAAAAPVFAPAEPAPGADERDASFAVLHGLHWLAAGLAEDGPLVLVVDDLHWCDRPSLRFLAYLARRLDDLDALLALGVRAAEQGADPALMAELAGAPGARVLAPRPLGAGAVAELARERLGAEPEPAFTAACLEAAGGNPLLVDRLLGSLADDGVAPTAAQAGAVRRVGPRAVSRAVIARLDRLPGDARAVAEALAVLGDGAPLPDVAALAGLDEGRAAAATAPLARAEILDAEPPLAFVHPLVRDAVYRALPPGERELRHARAADMLEARGAPAEEIATHLLVAPRRGDGRAAELLERAAASARRRGAPDSAVAYLARALGEPPPAPRRAAVMLDLGLAAAAVDGRVAAEHLDAARAALDDPLLRAAAAAELTRCLLFTRPPDEAVAVARAAARDAPPELADERRALEALELLGVAFGAPEGDAPARLAALRAAPPAGGPGARALAAVAAWDHALAGGSADECAALALDALDGGELLADGDWVGAGTAVAVLVMADRDEALAALDDLEAAGHRHGARFAVNTCHFFRGRAWLRRGGLADAEESLRQAIEVASLWGDVTWEVPELARVLVERGDLAGARTALEGAGSHSPHSAPAHAVRTAQIELLLAEGRAADALRVADDQAAHLRRIVNPAYAPWRTQRALALDALGRTAEAVDLAEDELAIARAWGGAAAVGRALRVLGTLRREEGLDGLAEAVAVLEPSPARLELARARAAQGAALRRAGRRSQSREPLLAALELADRCGAAGLADEVRAELRAAGLRPRTTALSGVDSLTASERRVAELAAQGRGNKQIAQALYVSLKTVEVHLSRAYRKLGISSRRELAGALRA